MMECWSGGVADCGVILDREMAQNSGGRGFRSFRREGAGGLRSVAAQDWPLGDLATWHWNVLFIHAIRKSVTIFCHAGTKSFFFRLH